MIDLDAVKELAYRLENAVFERQSYYPEMEDVRVLRDLIAEVERLRAGILSVIDNTPTGVLPEVEAVLRELAAL